MKADNRGTEKSNTSITNHSNKGVWRCSGAIWWGKCGCLPELPGSLTKNRAKPIAGFALRDCTIGLLFQTHHLFDISGRWRTKGEHFVMHYFHVSRLAMFCAMGSHDLLDPKRPDIIS